MKFALAIGALCLTLAAGSGFAQKPPGEVHKNSSSDRAVNATVVTQEPSPATLNWRERPEVIALDEQNKLIKQYQSSLLDTVYWALSTVGALIAVVVGANWIVNFRLNEQDKQRMRQDFETRMSEVQSSMDVRIANARVELQTAVQANLDALNNRVVGELLALRSEFKTDIDALTSRFQKLHEDHDAAKELFAIHDKRIYDVEGTVRQVEEHVWNLRGIPLNVLMTQAQGVWAAVQADNKWMVEGTLSRMKETLEKKMVGQDVTSRISTATQKDLVALVNSAATLAPVAVAEVTELIASVVTKTKDLLEPIEAA